jgi:putative CocE/NonD family hydrolase
VIVDFDVDVPMRDGTLLRANVYRPSSDGRWPVLLSRTPYGKDLPGASAFVDPLVAARSGYAVVLQDTRGRFTSGGEFRPFEDEARDGFDTLAWLAQQPFCDGNVGTFGASYLGFTQWTAAIEQAPALKAMVPFLAVGEPMDGLIFRGGAMELGTGASWAMMMGFDSLVRRYRSDPPRLGMAITSLAREVDALGPSGYWSLPLRQFAPLRDHPIEPWYLERMHDPLDTERLDIFVMEGKYQRVDVPTFNVGGWFDIFLKTTLRSFSAMRQLGKPTKLLIGPWTHVTQRNPVGELNFGFGSTLGLIDLRVDFTRLQLRWFDHWLRGIDTGMLDEPPVKIFVMGANVWRDEQEWPLARAVATPFYLRADGRLTREAPASGESVDSFVYDPADPVPTHGGATLMPPEFPAGPMDQRQIEARADVLTYTSEVLERDTEVTGEVEVRLWACTSAPDTDFVAGLVDVYPDGRALNVTDGILRTGHVEADQAYEHRIDLWATSNVFKAGHRIRVHVTSSSFPRWDRNQNTGKPLGIDAELRKARQTVLHDAEHASRVVLPLVS